MVGRRRVISVNQGHSVEPGACGTVGDTGFIEQVLGAAAPVIVQKDLLTIMDVPRSYDDYFVVVAHTEAAVWAP